MKRYILGYHCIERDLKILNKNTNLTILDALLDAYPSDLTATELANKTGLPIKTIYAQLDELDDRYIIEINNRKLPRPRGRPKNNTQSDVSKRKSSSVVIENANSLFDLYDGKKDTTLPPGNVSYSADFIKNISKILDQKDQINMNTMMLPIIRKIYRLTIENEDKKIKSIAPTNNEDYCCSQCGLNHEARDFIRAVLLYMIDQFEQSKTFIEFLKENKLLTLDAYENASKKIDINFVVEMGLENDLTDIANNSIINKESNEFQISKNNYEYDRDVKKIKNDNTEDQSFAKEDNYEKKIKLLLDGKIVEFNELREEDNFQFLDLSGANLSAANLVGANLSGANLSGATLSGANLSAANLSSSYLIGANLSAANLKEANLKEANLSPANLIQANLPDTDMSGANLSRANLSWASLKGANLSDADMSGANLSYATLLMANLSDANLVGANLSDAILIGANLSDANLPDADMSGANLSWSRLSAANLSGANLSDSIIIHSINYNSLIIDKKTDFNNGIIDDWEFIDHLSEFITNVPEKIKDKKELKRKLQEKRIRMPEKLLEMLLTRSQLPD